MEYKVSSLTHHKGELKQLEACQTTLPPDRERLSSLRIFCMHADEVVSVHDSVNESVQQDGEVDISIIHHICVEPVKEENRSVMVHMKE